jgi:hypothetical protein
MGARHFPYRLDWRFAGLWLPFGVRPGRDGVTVGPDELVATFGFLRARTPLANVRGGHVTERYRWYTAIGARLSFADDGLTFGTNHVRGVCVHFDDRIGAVIGVRPHSALTVTVEDCAGLLQAIGLDG